MIIDNEYYDVPCPFTREYLLKKSNKTIKQKFFEYLLEIKPHGYYCESFSCGWE